MRWFRTIAIWLLLCVVPLQGFAQGHCFVSAFGKASAPAVIHDCGQVMEEPQSSSQSLFAGCGHCSPLCAGAAIMANTTVAAVGLAPQTVFLEVPRLHPSWTEAPQNPPPIVAR